MKSWPDSEQEGRRQQRVLEEVSWETGFLSPMFLIPKPDGKVRQIFDLRSINDSLEPPQFRLTNQHKVPSFLQRNNYMVKIDLFQAYLHVPIKENHRRYLFLSYLGKLYNITCLPFGLSKAPVAFSRISNWLAGILRQKGTRTLVNQDEFLLAHQDPQELQNQALVAVDFLRSLGWVVNFPKSILNPTQRIGFLGIIWDTEYNQIILPDDKKLRILDFLEKLLVTKFWNEKTAKSQLGMLNFASIVIPMGRLFSRQLQRGSHRLSKASAEEKFPLPELSQSDCKWWRKNIHRPQPIFQPEPDIFLSTDASQIGWGFGLNGSCSAGLWTA